MTFKRRLRRKRHDTPAAGSDGSSRRAAWAAFALGVVLTGVLIGLKLQFEHSELGRQVEQMTVNLLQLRLTRAPQTLRPPVIVVDITGVRRRPRTGLGDPQIVTDATVLAEIVAAVADKGPIAIGVDVLLDPPTESDPLTPDEAALLALCREVAANRRIPTYVGIFEGVVRGPERWLGEARFADLAAFILIPRPREGAATASMIGGLRTQVDNQPIAIRSLARALADAGAAKQVESRWLGAWLADHTGGMVRRTNDDPRDGFQTDEFVVDFGALPELRRTTIPAANRADIRAASQSFADKIVLIGRAQTGQTMDVFTVPAASEPVAGVYVHASAVYTLMTAPLFELSHNGRLAADAIAALVPLGLVLVVSLWARRHELASVHQLARVTTWTMALVVAGVGYVWILWTGILWTDHLMVVAALLLHGPLERLGLAMYRRFQGHAAEHH